MKRRVKKWLRRGLVPILVPITKWYLKSSKDFSYKGIHLTVPQGVFHPGLFFSTKFFIQYLDQQELANQQVLELGAGSGLISLFCCKKGAKVTSSDVNQLALATLKENAIQNQCEPTIVYSDLFEELPQSFDWIIINPPYYPKAPQNEAEKAWFCGTNFDYFYRLAAQLSKHIHDQSTVLMVLSEDCDLPKIRSILKEKHFEMELTVQKEFWLEQNFIFRVVSTSPA